MYGVVGFCILERNSHESIRRYKFVNHNLLTRRRAGCLNFKNIKIIMNDLDGRDYGRLAWPGPIFEPRKH
jgi:hypothetical protein